MSILAASLSETVLEAGLAYLESDISVVACIGKRTTVMWSRWQVVRPMPGILHWWDSKGWFQNVAIICGQVSRGLVCIDLDGQAAVEAYEAQFPGLLNTFSVRSGSGMGMHYYYYVNEFTPTTRTKGFELRSDGCYVIAPPSKHPVSGNKYRVERYIEPKRVDNLEDVRQWIIGEIESKVVTRKELPSMGVKQATPYAIKALSSECDNVRSAVQGQRNRTLYLAALKMGNLIQMNYIGRLEVEEALMNAAALLSGADGEGASWRTICSGIERGITSNRRRA